MSGQVPITMCCLSLKYQCWWGARMQKQRGVCFAHDPGQACAPEPQEKQGTARQNRRIGMRRYSAKPAHYMIRRMSLASRYGDEHEPRACNVHATAVTVDCPSTSKTHWYFEAEISRRNGWPWEVQTPPKLPNGVKCLCIGLVATALVFVCSCVGCAVFEFVACSPQTRTR